MLSIIISEGALIALAIILLMGVIIQVADLVIRIRQLSTLPNKARKNSVACNEFPYDIRKLRENSEKMLYENCISKIMKAEKEGDRDCYLLSSASAPLPQWIVDKLLDYGLDIEQHTFNHDDSTFCRAFWDETASGKMRKYKSII